MDHVTIHHDGLGCTVNVPVTPGAMSVLPVAAGEPGWAAQPCIAVTLSGAAIPGGIPRSVVWVFNSYGDARQAATALGLTAFLISGGV